MKNLTFYLVILLLSISNLYPQKSIKSIGNYKYGTWENIWYTIMDNGERGNKIDTQSVVVQMKNGYTLKDITFEKYNLPNLQDVRGKFVDNFYELKIPKKNKNFDIVDRLYKTGLFEDIHFNFIGTLSSIYPNDSYYTSNAHWNLQKISMPNAWEHTTGNNSITVAVIDVGVDHDHPDLINNRWAGIGWDFIGIDSDPTPEYLQYSRNSHGTAVAGIICANLNNYIGISGISGGWNSQAGVSLMSLRAGKYSGNLMTDGMNIAACADAIVWAADNGADVICCSWNLNSYAIEIEMAISAVNDHNVIIVFSSGNITTKTGLLDKVVKYPASSIYTIAVGATTESDQRKEKFDNTDEPLWGSCYGSDLDVVAPGIHIPSTDYVGQYGYSVDDYNPSFNGTSAAAPHVAAEAALILSLNPNLSWEKVRDIIRVTADKVGGYTYPGGKNNEMGYGRIDINDALNRTLVVNVTGPTTLTGTQGLTRAPQYHATGTWEADADGGDNEAWHLQNQLGPAIITNGNIMVTMVGQIILVKQVPR